VYGEQKEWEDTTGGGEAAERLLVSQHAVHVARLASIPFGMAALAMVVRIPFSACLRGFTLPLQESMASNIRLIPPPPSLAFPCPSDKADNVLCLVIYL